jgi:NAD(P)-dependent dehydrogenase (short-subunit alcohol dehydrogenase family)
MPVHLRVATYDPARMNETNSLLGFRFDGRGAIVTGGASGIGRSTARRLARLGARVAVVDINGDAADEVAAEIDGIAYAVSVTDYDALASAFSDAAARFGSVAYLFNNAGGSNLAPIHEFPIDEWQRVVELNLTGVFYGLRAGVPLILDAGGGAIVSTASISGTRPAAGEAPYAAAKAAVAALTAGAALEYAPSIRVNAVSPGMIHTSLTDLLLSEKGMNAAGWMVDKTPLARIGQPDDIADVVCFLLSDLARFITGQNLVVDGGMTLHGSGVDGVLDRVQALLDPGRT